MSAEQRTATETKPLSPIVPRMETEEKCAKISSRLTSILGYCSAERRCSTREPVPQQLLLWPPLPPSLWPQLPRRPFPSPRLLPYRRRASRPLRKLPSDGSPDNTCSISRAVPYASTSRQTGQIG